MKTKIFNNPIDYIRAAEIIKNGGLVAFPTETVYGLGADGLNSAAVRKIFEVKGRAGDNPLILHVCDLEGVLRLTSLDCFLAHRRYAHTDLTDFHRLQNIVEVLFESFMPGPLTLVLPKNPRIPDEVTAGLPTVAIRVPSHPIAREFIKACGVPIAAPSANISGRPSCTTAKHVIDDMYGKIEGIIDGGASDIGLESTILDLSVEVPTILRQGGMTIEQIREVVGDGVLDVSDTQSDRPKAPGMKYRHYAPKAPLYIVEDIEGEAKKYKGQKIGKLYAISDLEKYANELFDKLRGFDDEGVDIILAERVPNVGIGEAINNRLKKAAKG